MKLIAVKFFFETSVGKTLAKSQIPRKDLFVQTKFASQPHHRPFLPPYPAYEGDDVDSACEISCYRSLENLQTDYIDAFLIHAPEIPVPTIFPVLETLRLLKSKGLVRYTGLCNIPTIDVLQQLHTAYSDVLQIVQNPLHSHTDPDYKIPRYCREVGIQYNTFYTLVTSDRIIQDQITQKIAGENNLTPQQVFLQYCVQSEITPLFSARREANLVSALAIANGEVAPLSVDHMQSIDSLMVEQVLINQHRANLSLKRQERRLRQEQGKEKWRRDQQEFFNDTLADWERLEQRIVDRAKARARQIVQRDQEVDAQLRQRLTGSVREEEEMGEVIEEVPPLEMPIQAQRVPVEAQDEDDEDISTFRGQK